MSERELPAEELSGDTPRAPRRVPTGILLIIAGVVALAVLSVVERRWLDGLPWTNAVRTIDYVMGDPEAIPIWSWELTPAQSLGESALAQAVQQDLLRKIETKKVAPERLKEESPVVALSSAEMLDEALLPKARLVMFDRDPEFFAPILASGRLPQAGTREILAGPLLSERPLEFDGETYAVVGRLHPHVSGFVKTFVMPRDVSFRTELDSAMKSADEGSVHLDGADRIAELIPKPEGEALSEAPLYYGGGPLTGTAIAWGVWCSLLLVAVGATMSFMALFCLLSTKNLPFLNVAMEEAMLRSRLLWGLYIFMFGGFFGAMAVGISDTEMNYLFTEFASHQFTEGGLKYVGDAYKSGNIPRAAHATFQNNFLIQTLYMGAIPNMVLLGAGVLKTLASFVVVGFAMAPVWSGTASGMTYHALTLALELPPYVFSAFGMLVWAMAVCRFVWSPVRVWYLGDKAHGVPVIEDATQGLPRALRVLAETLVVTGVLLYVAAWYEATTLILFR